MGKLQGKVALVSGAGRGQGRSHAVRCAREGADLVILDICDNLASVPYPLATCEDLSETARLVEAEGRRVIAWRSDVRDPAAVQASVGAGFEAYGRLDIVIANAGIYSGAGDVAVTSAAWLDTIDVNLTGVFNTLEAAVPIMVNAGNGGSIVITNSCGGLKAMATSYEDLSKGYLGYTASKHGLMGLLKAYALALGPLNIRVNSVHPTGVNTMMVVNEVVEAHLGKRSAHSPFHNVMPVSLLEAEDVTDAVVWLCSDEAKWITGAALPVDGGFLLT